MVRKAERRRALQELNRKSAGKVVHNGVADPKAGCKIYPPHPASLGRAPKWLRLSIRSVALRAMEGWFGTSPNQKERPAGEGRARRHPEQSSTGIFWREDLQDPLFRGKNKPISGAGRCRSGFMPDKQPPHVGDKPRTT